MTLEPHLVGLFALTFGAALLMALAGEQRRPPARRAFVFQAPPEELQLLAKPKLSDRPVGNRALAVVGAAGGSLELLIPVRAKLGEVAFRPLLREAVSLGGGLGKRQETGCNEREAGPMYRADGRKRRPVRFCSRMCADQPATREQPNIAGASGGGISATSSTIAE